MNRIKYLFLLSLIVIFAIGFSVQELKPPGRIIKHLPAVQKAYLGSPSICKLSSGEYLVSCDIFGKDTKENRTLVFFSEDRGDSWKEIAVVEQFWSTLFEVKDTLYLIGTLQANGHIVIRRSTDKGKNWTAIRGEGEGMLLKGRYHTAPTNIVVRDNKVYKAFEDANRDEKWPSLYGSFILSADMNSDLLDANSWKQSQVLYRDSVRWEEEVQGWLEGNVVTDRNDSLSIIMRVHTLSKDKEFAAHIPLDNGEPKAKRVQLHEFPGGSKKFDIKFDKSIDRYWSLVNYVPDEYRGIKQLDRIRNSVYLVSSANLVDWKLEQRVLFHEDMEKHGFQYLSFLIEGNDIIAVCRTAYDDAYKGASDYHNSNFITFHRIANFRNP